VRAKVEHAFRVVKRQFGHTQERDRGLVKNTAPQHALFAQTRLWMVRRKSLHWMTCCADRR
jgi:IS5 family transposase